MASPEIPPKVNKSDMEQKEYREFLWQEPGFHRTLGSIWFQYIPYVAIAFFSIIYFVVILPGFIPPETMGSDMMFKALLGFFFALAQVGVGDAIQRFVSEKRISQPQYTIYYVQFFIWFRLFSGLIMVTAVSIWVFTFLRNFVPLAYSMWFFMMYAMLEWPGFWLAYMSAMQGYQQFNKVNYITAAMMIVNIITGYLMITLFKYIGSLFPAMGEGFGNSIGFVVGLYLNNIIVFVISAYFFKKLIAQINPEWSLIKTFKVEFSREIFQECLRFGAQSMAATFLDTGFKMIITYLAVLWLPNYATIYGIFAVTINLVALIAVDIPITPIVSEAFNNHKIDLTEYYMGHGLKYCGMFASMFGSTLLAIGPIFLVLAGPYALAATFLPYIASGKIIWAFSKVLEDCTTGCNRPFYRFYYYLIENAVRLSLMVWLIFGLEMGWIGYLIAEIGGYLAKNIGGWIIFRVKIMNPYVSGMQTIVLPFIAGLVHFGALRGMMALLFAPMAWLLGNVITISLFILIGFIITPIYIWWPTYTILGGWDPVGLDIMQEATEISDISKPIAKQFNSITQKLARKSPFYNHFRIHFRSAQFELDDLRVMMGREPRKTLHVWDFLPKLIILDREVIMRRIYAISMEKKTFEDYVLELAEVSLQVQDAIRHRPCGVGNRLTEQFEINPDFLNPKPNRVKIEKLAKEIIETQHPSMEDLHRLIAERQVLYEYLLELQQSSKKIIKLEMCAESEKT